jgi:hypothetical protein
MNMRRTKVELEGEVRILLMGTAESEVMLKRPPWTTMRWGWKEGGGGGGGRRGIG